MSWKTLAEDAISVQDACNLSGVVHSFSRAISEVKMILEDEGVFSTDKLKAHPICVMYASKIASLTNCEVGEEFAKAYEWCKNQNN